MMLAAAGKSLTPLYIAAAITYITLPVIKKLERAGVQRRTALVCTFLLLIIGIFSIFRIGLPYLVSGIMSLQKAITEYASTIELPAFLGLEGVLQGLSAYALSNAGGAVNTLISTVHAVFNTVLGIVLSFYIILDREKIAAALIGLIPPSARMSIMNVMRKIDIIIKQFLVGQLAVAGAISIILFASLLIMRVKYAFVLAILAGALEIIPYFGPILSAIPAVAIAASDSLSKAIWTAVLFIAVQQLENAYLTPKILGDSVGLHPVITIMAVVTGGHLFGFFGMILAVPVCGMIQVIMEEIIEILGEKR